MTIIKSNTQTKYITTAIPFVNAKPHVGFAAEMIQADCLARLYRSQGIEVRFQAGTDDNSLKNVLAAQEKGITVEELVETNANRFYELKEALNLSFDDFICTSSDVRHRPGVEKLWAKCLARGDIYKREYVGLYCVGCEQFYKAQELLKGKCPEHHTKPNKISEENYFFRLSKYEKQLRDVIVSGQLEITPPSRRNEVLAFIDRGLEDFSISRSAARAQGWGIPVPNDPEQIIYVWFDALANYISALGYGTDNNGFDRFWQNSASREHVIGKGITRFHAIYWPAILLSAQETLPTRLLVHGYLTVGGQKIGKSLGNAIDPVPLAEQLGEDALRYFLLRHIRSTEDGDFEHARFLHVYDTELAGQLGNLVNRTKSMVEKYCSGVIPKPDTVHQTQDDFQSAIEHLPNVVATRIENFQFHVALSDIWSVVAHANRYVAQSEPWVLAKKADQSVSSIGSETARNALDNCLYKLVNSLFIIGQCLTPLLPNTSEELLRQLGSHPQLDKRKINGNLAGLSLNSGRLLFPKRN